MIDNTTSLRLVEKGFIGMTTIGTTDRCRRRGSGRGGAITMIDNTTSPRPSATTSRRQAGTTGRATTIGDGMMRRTSILTGEGGRSLLVLGETITTMTIGIGGVTTTTIGGATSMTT